MTKELQSLLSVYLGELIHKRETTFDWIEKNKITKKYNAACVLLDIPGRELTETEEMFDAVNRINFDL